ncbi:hypothetical protein HPC49_17480 [Pyxidicoccus fallax]|uniref:DUF3618 domain-containing protein n=1 Tax=Pyxidicoccus fallax TaxID=394095 RepID=A0A848LNY5_9BACT|nr:hypothetical protein [Pyxidicoccus fallax]NMO19313.1 hypothetical protein [Pyxidicoccus fallax]NPC80005.1 hypothetical protein [Pyxidicoccus fallax]
MGEQDRALHEIADARARLTELADELARKAEPDRLKAMAHEKAEELKERAKEFATEKAGELKQHARDAAVGKATELKTHAKETVMQRTTELKERADTPKGWSLLGALIGAGVGSALMRRAFTMREERSYEGGRYDTRYGRYGDERWREDDRWRYDGLRAGRPDLGYSRDDRYATADRADIGYGAGTSYGDVSGYQGVSSNYDVSNRDLGNVDTSGDGGMKARAGEAVSNVKERASDVAHNVRDRASDVKDRAMGKATEVRERAMGAVDNLRERASHVRERIPSREVVQGRTSEWFTRTVDEQPILLALGGIALGMLASTIIPVSNKERRLIEPAKRRAEESITQLGDQLNQKLQGSEQSSDYEGRQGYSSSNMSATSDLTTSASTNTGFGASSISGTPSSASGLGATNTGGVSVAGTEDNADALASSPSGSSRIPPLPPLDDVTKVH